MKVENVKYKNQSEEIENSTGIKQNNTENKNDVSKKANADLINEQYSQYYQMLRHHTSLSWSIPSFAIACTILFFGLDASKIQSWHDNPIIPAACFLFIGLFLFVMRIHHNRNGFYAKMFDEALLQIEQKFGFEVKVHHSQLEPGKSILKRISSSLCLSIFLGLSIVVSLSISIYFFCQILK